MAALYSRTIGLVGVGGFGREVMPELDDYIRTSAPPGTTSELVFVVTGEPPSREVNGYPVLTEEEFLGREGPKLFNVAIADGEVRRTVAERLIDRGAQPLSIQSSTSVVHKHNSIGEGAIFCAGSIVTSNATIGRFFHCNLQSYVAHDCVVGDFVTFAPAVRCNGNIVVEDGAYIGTGATLRQGTREKPLRIGRGAVVGMGAVVTKDVPAGEVWVGNPAKKLHRS